MRRNLLLVLAALAVGVALGAAGAEPLRIRVVTYNIHHAEGMDGTYDVERIAKVLQPLAPDLVALQEVHRRTTTSRQRDQAADLGEALGLSFFFGKAMDHAGGDYGEAVLSTLDILSSTNHVLPNETGTEPRAAADIVVDAGQGRRVRFLGTHLDHRRSPSTRILQIERLVAALGSDTNTPAILAGDFNCAPASSEMALLAGEWRNAWGDAVVPTWPADKPRAPIDHVLFRPAHRWRVVECRAVEERIASDHLPVLAVMELLPE
jgi:endonuclease/exonuclease/phosphatase family metal-dependent hydrolase